MSVANERQVGGDHYRRTPGEQHWDRAVRLRFNFFQYMITKYIERAPLKNGRQDVEKALHFTQKWLESWDAMHPPKEGPTLHINISADTTNLQEAIARVRSDLEEAAMGNSAALDWLLENVVLTREGNITINGDTYTCLRGARGDFHYEGGYGDGRDMWSCSRCRVKVYTTGNQLPHALHARDKCTPPESAPDTVTTAPQPPAAPDAAELAAVRAEWRDKASEPFKPLLASGEERVVQGAETTARS